MFKQRKWSENKKVWTVTRNRSLKRLYLVVDIDHLVERYSTTREAIRVQAQRIGAPRKRKNQPWTQEERYRLWLIGRPITHQVARQFNRTPVAVRDELRRMEKLFYAKALTSEAPK